MTADRGSVTAFVACFTLALIAVAGLVIDGGLVLAARQRAFNDADAAARAGAQAVDETSVRSGGTVVIDRARAERLVRDHLSAAGATGSAQVDGDTVTVVVDRAQDLSILGFAGLGPVTIHASGTAHAVRGVRNGGD